VCGALLLTLTGAAAADVVHLRNGGTIACDRIEERGEILLLHQGKGTIQVPRQDVLRIESGGGAAGTPPPAVAPPAGPPAAPLAATDPRAGAAVPEATKAPSSFDRDAALRRVDELKRRQGTPALARDENRRQLVALLSRLGEDELMRRQPDEARRHFSEAITYEPHDVRARCGLAAAYLKLDQDAYARSVLQQALLDAPDDPDLNLLLGQVAQRQDHPEEALAAWQKSFAARPSPELGRWIETLRRQQGIEQNYGRSEAAHFVVRYDGETTRSELESSILEELERQYAALARTFDYMPPQSIVVIIYPERAFYEATLAGPDVAGLYDGKIRMPAGGLHQLDAEARATLLHELAHAFITGKSGSAAPRWLQEGLAQWIEGKRTPAGTGLSLAKEFQAHHEAASWQTVFSYPSALSFVEFLIDRQGFAALNDLLAAMGRGQSPQDALRSATGFPFDDLQVQWGQNLTRRHLQ
jgi:tetratricopeptide (TPR) repeat protein